MEEGAGRKPVVEGLNHGFFPVGPTSRASVIYQDHPLLPVAEDQGEYLVPSSASLPSHLLSYHLTLVPLSMV